MSGISRRSVLGVTGTAAAGTILATAVPAQAAQPGGTTDPTAAAGAPGAAAPTTAQQADTAAPVFPVDTRFTANASPTFPGGEDNSYLTITFSVRCDETPDQHVLTPADVADALSAYAQTKGWPPLTFYGAPAPVAVN